MSTPAGVPIPDPSPSRAGLWPADLAPPPGQPAAAAALTLDICTEGRWQQDAQGHITWACPAMLQLCGATLATLPGSTLAQWFGADAPALLAQGLAQGHPCVRLCRAGVAGECWFQFTLVLWQDGEGVSQGGRGVVRDITEVVALEQRLQRSGRSLLALVETASEGIAVVQDQVFRFVNKHLQTLLGIRAERLIDRPFLEVIRPTTGPR